MIGRLLVLPCAMLMLGATDARADIVVFKSGKTMSVKAVAQDGDQVKLVLREGGEVTFGASLIVRVDPDEVPWPEPASRESDAGSRPSGGGSRELAELAAAPVLDPRLSARPYADLIASAAATHGVDVRLVHAVIETESNYQPRARSKKGAKGLMQLMPETARQYAVKDPYDPKSNIEAGVKHLKDLLSRFDVSLALAAYNAGEATIRRFGGLPPYAETKSYVARVMQRVAN